MTAHDDDQELVTIRIPRRAAALYAAELDVAASPVLIRAGAYVPVGVAGLALLLTIVLVGAGVFQVLQGNLFFASTLLFGSIVWAIVCTSIWVTSVLRLRALERRGLIARWGK